VAGYFCDDGHAKDKHTVVTEARTTLANKRVLRGREAQRRAFYVGRVGHATA